MRGNVESRGVRRSFANMVRETHLIESFDTYTNFGIVTSRIDAVCSGDVTSVHMTDMISVGLSSLVFENEWIVDTGSTNYMTSHMDLFDIRRNNIKFLSVWLLNGTKFVVTHIGSCDLGDGCILHDILLVSDFAYNLISMYKPTNDLSCSGEQVGGLYFLKNSPVSQESRVRVSPMAAASDATDDMTLHKRFMHASLDKLKILLLSNCNESCAKDCHICPLAKQTRLAFPIDRNHALESFVLLHMNVWGPFVLLLMIVIVIS